MGSDAAPAGTPAPAAPAAPEAAPAAPAAAPPSSPTDFQARAAALLDASPDAPPAAKAPAAPPALDVKAPPAEAALDPFSPKFAQLAEASKRARAEEDAAKARLREDREALRREQAELDDLRKAKASGSPVKTLMALGWTYEDATNEVLGKGVGPKKEADGPKVDPKVAELEAKVARMEAAANAHQERAAIADLRATMVQAVASGGDKYALVHSTKSVDDALNLILNHARAHGELPGGSLEAAVEFALNHFETQLETRYYAPDVLTVSKVRQRVPGVVEAPKPAADRPQATSAKSPPSALTNSLAAAAPTRPATPEPRTKEDFIRAAAAVLDGDAG